MFETTKKFFKYFFSKPIKWKKTSGETWEYEVNTLW